MLDSAFFNGLPSLPYKPSLAKNPSYPKQAVPLVTMNPLSPLRSSNGSLASTSTQVRKFILEGRSPTESVSEDRLEDTAREMERQQTLNPTAAVGVPSDPSAAAPQDMHRLSSTGQVFPIQLASSTSC